MQSIKNIVKKLMEKNGRGKKGKVWISDKERVFLWSNS